MHLEIPLLSPKPLSEFTPKEFRDYVKGMFKAPPAKQEVLFKFTKKGNPQVTIRRTPKWISEVEFKTLCQTYGVRQNEMFLYLKDREIELRRPSGTQKKKGRYA